MKMNRREQALSIDARQLDRMADRTRRGQQAEGVALDANADANLEAPGSGDRKP